MYKYAMVRLEETCCGRVQEVRWRKSEDKEEAV